MSTDRKDPRSIAAAAEICADEEDWDRLEDAAHELLSIARRKKSERGDD